MRNGRRCGALQRDVPALAVLTRSAGERHFEVQTVDIPRLTGRVRANLHVVRLQQIFGRLVIAMVVLDAAIQRELMVRPHVQFERRQPGPFAVVNPLRIGPVAFTTGLPVSFEERRPVI